MDEGDVNLTNCDGQNFEKTNFSCLKNRTFEESKIIEEH